MRYLEFLFRVYIQNGFYLKMANYHADKVRKFNENTPRDRYMHHSNKLSFWLKKSLNIRGRIDELKLAL